MSTGKVVGIAVAIVALVGAVWLGSTLIDVDQTEPGKLPDVDVAIDAEAGRSPNMMSIRAK